jgi:hypothetical protein
MVDAITGMAGTAAGTVDGARLKNSSILSMNPRPSEPFLRDEACAGVRGQVRSERVR